jgi:hypothetical protein
MNDNYSNVGLTATFTPATTAFRGRARFHVIDNAIEGNPGDVIVSMKTADGSDLVVRIPGRETELWARYLNDAVEIYAENREWLSAAVTVSVA